MANMGLHPHACNATVLSCLAEILHWGTLHATRRQRQVANTRACSACCRCGHCKHLTPEYKKLGEAVADSPKLKDRVVIAKVLPLHPRWLFISACAGSGDLSSDSLCFTLDCLTQVTTME